MPTITEVRKQYPQYDDLSDDQLAGALHKKFYSDMPVEEFRAKIGLQPPASNRIAQAFDVASDPIADQSLRPDYNQYGFTENMMRSLPFGDEVGSGGAALGRYLAGKSGLAPEVGLSEQYERQRALDRAEQERYARQNPVANVGGQVLGIAAGGAPTGAAAAFGIRGAPAAVQIPATLGGRVAEGVRTGAPLGALYGAGEGEGLKERAANAATGAVGGAVVGAALPTVAAGVRGAFGRRTVSGPTVDQLRQQANAFYTQMDRAGVQLAGPAFQRIAQNVAARARLAGVDPSVHPRVTGALRRLLSDASGARGSAVPTLRHMDTLRQIMRDAAGDPGERRIARIMVEGLDDNLNRLQTRDIVAGNQQVGLTAVREARQLWQRMRKGELIDNLFENARDKTGANYTQAGLHTALRQEFRALAKRIRDGKERGWTNAERAAIERVVRGGPVENVLRLIGKAAPRGVFSAAPAFSAGYLFDPVTGAAVAGAGEIGKRAATAMGMRSADRVSDLVRAGGVPVPPLLTPGQQQLSQLRRLLVEEGAGGSGKGGLGERLLTGAGGIGSR
jgi:hypothetical protein